MEKLPEESRDNEGILEFPVETDFISKPSKIDPQAMLKRIAQNMSMPRNRHDEAVRRLSEKIDVEFVL
ncbi:MAG TPA: hypothetical protein VGO67_14080 [Verrucomicrobiae bacterium]|jgi:hypothetical protein